MLVASVKEIRKGVQVQGKTTMNYCRHVAEGLAACTRYGSACTCFWFTPNTSSALWTWVVLSATYVSLRVTLFFPVRDRRICTSTSDQPIAFVVPLIVPYQEEKPYSPTGNEPCTTPPLFLRHCKLCFLRKSKIAQWY